MQPPETQYAVRGDGVSIAYQVWGSGPVDLLYAPGFVSHLDVLWADPGFKSFWERMGGIARVVAYDKPGTGCSDPIPYVPSVEERAADILCVLDAAGSERAVVMGFSEGGPASALLAASAPERVVSLILYGSFAGAPRPDMAPHMHEQWKEGVAGWRAIVDTWGRGGVIDFFAPSAAGRVQRRLAAMFERAAASPAMARALIDAVERIDVREVLPSVRVPTLVLHRTGDAMPIAFGRDLAQRIPGARFVELPGVDHAFWFGEHQQISEEIERFVTGRHPVAPAERVLTTVLFTDVVDSTRRVSELGDTQWRTHLERHNATADDTVGHAGGRVVKWLGDGMLATFDSPAGAVRCAMALRDELAGAQLPIRAGVHTGECERIGDDLGGVAVHIGARVSALAAPGEILVSSTVADLVMGSGLRFDERGVHSLKGVPGAWRLLAVSGEGPRPQIALEDDALRPSDRAMMRLAQRFPGTARTVTRLASRRD